MIEGKGDRGKFTKNILRKVDVEMFNRFMKKPKGIEEFIVSPMHGEVIHLSEVPDPVFAQKMVGDGVAIIPKEGTVVSPVKGEVIQVFPTKHAIGIRSEHGLEVLIHIGLETVELNGNGFEVFVSAGQKVVPGERLLKVDLEILNQNNKKSITPIIITNMDEKVGQIELLKGGEVQLGEVIFKCLINGK